MQKRTWVLPAILLFAAAVCAQGAGKGTISLTDEPIGYAGLGKYATSKGKTVSTKQELVNAVKSGGVIIINGMIDMSEGMLVAEGGKSTDSTPELDAFVKKQTSGKYETYEAWITAYSEACKLSTDDDKPGSGNSKLQGTMKTLNTAYGKNIRLDLQSNTTLIGATPGSGIRGGSIQIRGKSNIQIRNLTIQDPFDPFPQHEANSKGDTDGYNAQWDGINIQDTCKNIWVDHVTIEDTITLGYVKTAGKTTEKWQTYDGVCDLKNDTTNVTISNCLFRNHDKTMVMGNNDKDGNKSKRFVTLAGNYFLNCGQRPLVRNTTLHILNNYFDADKNAPYKQQYAVSCRKDCAIYSEGNYFGPGIQYSFKDNDGKLYIAGDIDKSAKKNTTKVAGKTLFKDAVNAYTYTAVSAEEAKTNAEKNAGAGYTLSL